MRVAVIEGLGLHQRTDGLQLLEHGEIGRRGAFLRQKFDGFQGREAHEVGGHATVVAIGAVVGHRAVDLQLVAEAGKVVVLAMAGGCVHAASTALGGHVVGEHHRGGSVDEGMAGLEVLEIGPAHRAQDSDLALEAAVGGKLFQQCRCYDKDLRTVAGEHVVELRMHCDGEIGGQRPRRGRPDDDAGGHFGGQAEPGGLGGGQREAHPDRHAAVVAVFDLGLGQSGLEGDRPVHGFLAAVDQALLNEAGEGAQNVGLEGGCLGLVLVCPVGEHAQALELGGLGGDPGLGEVVAALAQFCGGEGFLLRLDLA